MSNSRNDDEKKNSAANEEQKANPVNTEQDSIKLMQLTMIKKILSEYEKYLEANTDQAAKRLHYPAVGDPEIATNEEKAGHKRHAISQLLVSAQILSLDGFAERFGELEDFITIRRSKLDPSDSMGKKLINEIHANVPELSDNPAYKLGKISAALDILSVTLNEKLQEARKGDINDPMLINLEAVARDVEELEKSIAHKPRTKDKKVSPQLSPSEKLVAFETTYSAVSKSIQRRGINPSLFSMFSDSPGIVFTKKIEQILPEIKPVKKWGKTSI